jgi:hypothetical protein
MLGAFAKLGKATICFVMSVRMSFRMEQHGFHWNYSHEIWCLKIFRNPVEKIEVSLKSDKLNGTLILLPVITLYSRTPVTVNQLQYIL